MIKVRPITQIFGEINKAEVGARPHLKHCVSANCITCSEEKLFSFPSEAGEGQEGNKTLLSSSLGKPS